MDGRNVKGCKHVISVFETIYFALSFLPGSRDCEIAMIFFLLYSQPANPQLQCCHRIQDFQAKPFETLTDVGAFLGPKAQIPDLSSTFHRNTRKDKKDKEKKYYQVSIVLGSFPNYYNISKRVLRRRIEMLSPRDARGQRCEAG